MHSPEKMYPLENPSNKKKKKQPHRPEARGIKIVHYRPDKSFPVQGPDDARDDIAHVQPRGPRCYILYTHMRTHQAVAALPPPPVWPAAALLEIIDY